MKMEIVYKCTCVLLGICFITMMGYNVGVSKGEETDTSKDEIPDLWELTKPKVEWIELGYWEHRWDSTNYTLRFYINLTNTLTYPVPILGMVRGYERAVNGKELYPVHYPIWFLNTTEGLQYHVGKEYMRTYDVVYRVYPFYSEKGAITTLNSNSILPNKTFTVILDFNYHPRTLTEETIYYEVYIESQHTIVKGVCEIPNITV